MPRPSRSVRMKSFSASAGSPKNLCAALVFQHQKLALDGSDRLFRDIAVLRGQLGGVFGDVGQDRPQVLHVQQQQPLLVGHLEGDVEHAFLDVVQIHHARQQQRTHFGDGGAHRMALLAEHVPKYRRKLVGLERQAHIAGPLDDKILGLARFPRCRRGRP